MMVLNELERIELAKIVMAMLDQWGVSAQDRINILGLPEDMRTRHLQKYRDNTPLPEDDQVMERVEHLLGISSALRTTYPLNAHMGPLWMKKPHRRFDKRTPIATIVEDGLSGLIAVRAHLDCSFAWSQT